MISPLAAQTSPCLLLHPIAKLLTSLNRDNQKQEIRQEEIQGSVQGAIQEETIAGGGVFSAFQQMGAIQEETIAALQDIIASERKKGVPDADIQREVDKSYLGLSIDEILAYELKAARTSALPIVPPVGR